jgi:hypothetical protein
MKRFFPSLFLISTLATLARAEVDVKKTAPNTTPIIEFYKRDGSSPNCMIPLGVGTYNFTKNACDNDQAHFFIVKYPREGVMFGIYDEMNCNHTSGAWAVYRIHDPIHMIPTEKLNVDAGYAIHDDGVGTEIVPGIYTVSHDSQHRQLAGKVSCLRVFPPQPAAKLDKKKPSTSVADRRHLTNDAHNVLSLCK